MPKPARRRATYEDLLAAPEHMVAEILDGELKLSPRPAGPHAEAAAVLTVDLGSAFHRGRGGATYRALGTYGENEHVRAPPFEAIELQLEALWPNTVTPLPESE